MPRPFDHLVLAVRDLEAAGRLYGRLGFQVGARNRHPWGTENRLVQLPGAFLELVTVADGALIPPHEDRSFSFGAFVRDYLARREGFAMLALASEDAATDARIFAAVGIGDYEPFCFERRGRRPDGTEVQLAFTLAFARDPRAPDVGFFVCEHHRPENFWNPDLQRHPNGVVAITAVAVAAPDPRQHRDFLTAFTGAAVIGTGEGLSVPLDGARIDVLTADDAAAAFGSVEAEPGAAAFVGFTVRASDLARVAREVAAAGIPHQAVGSRLVVPPSVALGIAIAFEPA